MTDKTKRKRNNFLSFRVSEKTLKNLNLMAKQTGKTRGIMGKDAMKNWLKLELFNQTNEMITISKRMFTKLLSLLKQEELNAIAEDNSTLFANILKFLVEVPMNEDTLKKYGTFSTEFFGKTGFRWFNTLDIQIRENRLIFKGLHDLDENFSTFFTHFYKKLLTDHFNLDIVEYEQDLSPQLILLEFAVKNTGK